jgi:hypothetical protein
LCDRAAISIVAANRCSFHAPASAALSWAFTGGGPLFTDWQVRRATPRLTLGP